MRTLQAQAARANLKLDQTSLRRARATIQRGQGGAVAEALRSLPVTANRETDPPEVSLDPRLELMESAEAHR
jgi:hypothetical protein